MAPPWGMIDLETLATSPDAQVLTIGCTKFDPFSFAPTHTDFYMRVDIGEQEELGRVQSDDTLEWWGRQCAAAQEEAFTDDERVDVRTMLRALKKWYVGCDGIWQQGFMDTSIIEDMCRQMDEPIPWPHWQVGDSRQFLKRMPHDPREDDKFLAHHALEDSKAQVLALRKTFAHFGMTK
jgi:exodeoxyribonuclease VIII